MNFDEGSLDFDKYHQACNLNTEEPKREMENEK